MRDIHWHMKGGNGHRLSPPFRSTGQALKLSMEHVVVTCSDDCGLVSERLTDAEIRAVR